MNNPDPRLLDFEGRRQWQTRLLPFMIAFLSIMTMYFVIETVLQIRRLQSDFRHELPTTLDSALTKVNAMAAADTANSMAYSRMAVLVALESDAMQQRHHQTNLLLLSRTWTRYMAFLSGMVLVLVGAVFILGKLQEDMSELSIGNKDLSGSIKSASPGLIMCFMGTLLLISATVVSVNVEMKDAAVFTQGLIAPAPQFTPQAPYPPSSSDSNDAAVLNADPNR